MRLITSSLSLVPVFILSALGSLILPVSPAPSPAVFSGIDVCTDPSGIICCNSVFYAANYHTPLPVGKILELEDVLDSLAPLELKPKNSSCHHLDHADHDHDHDHNHSHGHNHSSGTWGSGARVLTYAVVFVLILGVSVSAGHHDDLSVSLPSHAEKEK